MSERGDPVLVVGRLKSLLASLLLVAAIGHPGPALAQSAAEAATKWGLLGNWKVDCNAPVSRRNYSLTYVVRGAALVQERDWGDGSDSNTVPRAVILADGRMQVMFVYPANYLEVTWLKEGTRHRAMESRVPETGEYIIRDGKFVTGGAPSQWQYRCR